MFKNLLSWNEYYMSVAISTALRSKDPVTKVGSVIVYDKKIIGAGYNGFPNGCDDSYFPWNKDKSTIENKYTYVVHSEANCILNTSNPSLLKGSKMFVTLFPCNDYCKLIIQAGIKEVVFLEKKEKELNVSTEKMFNASGVIYTPFHEPKESFIKKLGEKIKCF